ncbi:MAG: hypothetical protein GIW99_02450 [Candidatus Eremiobacteraeota bacterium]|nr:hypothetical protein [Candidatus Eremiobacteraeota bacterium]MBC5826536.1 hypothetical protein [Candidatus Eremiobacteraeota bacterium]
MAKKVQAAVRFVAAAIAGGVLGAFIGLFSYANSVQADVHDGRFGAILCIGIVSGLIGGFFWARRGLKNEDAGDDPQVGISLLKKYHRSSVGGEDSEAGQYSIGDAYLKKLLGRR